MSKSCPLCGADHPAPKNSPVVHGPEAAHAADRERGEWETRRDKHDQIAELVLVAGLFAIVGCIAANWLIGTFASFGGL